MKFSRSLWRYTRLTPTVLTLCLSLTVSVWAATPAPMPAAGSTTTASFARLSWADDETQVSLTGPDGRAVPARLGAILAAGSTVRTGNSGVELELVPNGSRIKLAASTTFRLSVLATAGKPGDNSFELVSGKLRMLAKPVATGQGGYEIRTASAVCAVRGTDFARQYDPEGNKDWLCVLQGLIDFSSSDGKEALLVNGGQFVSLAKGWVVETAPKAWLDTNLADIAAFRTP